MNKFVFALASVAMSGAAVFVATAPVAAQTPAITVPTAGYDLDDPAGYDAVAARVQRAAGVVCGRVDMRNLDQVPEFNSCRSAALEDGIRQLDTIARNAQVTVSASR